MTLGDCIKVCLPGEWPFAECVHVYDDGAWEGRIVNRLVGEMSYPERLLLAQEMFSGATAPLPSLHEYRRGDVVRFAQADVCGALVWAPHEYELPRGSNAAVN